MVKATLAALQNLTSPRAVAAKRGKKVGDIVGRREGAQRDAKEESDA
jgi:small subunit ribosomal protein S5